MKNSASTTIIIPTFNSEGYLSKTLECLVKQEDPDFNVLIVDDFSTDSTCKIAARYQKFLELVITHKTANDPKGAASSLNIAFGQIDTPYFALIDSDAYLEVNWLKEMKKGISRKKQLWGAPILSYNGKSFIGYLSGLEIESRYNRIPHGTELLHLSTCNLFGHKEIVQDVSLDTDLYYGYDHQLSYLMNKKKQFFYLNKNTNCQHQNKSSLWQFFKQQYFIGVNQLKLTFRYPKQASRKDMISPLSLALQPPLTLAMILSVFFNYWLSSALFIVLIGLNLYFLAFLLRKKRARLIPAAIGLIIIRSLAWIAGITVGIYNYLLNTIK